MKWSAEWRIARAGLDGSASAGIRSAYLIGCGRSGTTVCGDALKSHPDIQYFFEPYHLWSTIDPVSDVLNLFQVGTARLLMDQQHCTEEAKRRFRRLLLEPA